VLHLAVQGCPDAAIATRLYISRRTVEVLRTNMMRKPGLRTEAQLIIYAIRRGILPLDGDLPPPASRDILAFAPIPAKNPFLIPLKKLRGSLA
jgi:hypothetical protein